MKGLAFSAGVAADLAVVEDQGHGVGQKPDHGQHHQGRRLVDGRVFEVTVGGEGLKDFGVDSPTAAAELMDKQRRDRSRFEVGGVEIGARLRPFRLAFAASSVFFADRDATLVFDTNRFDDPYRAIGGRPIEVRQVPVLNLPARLRLNAVGRILSTATTKGKIKALMHRLFERAMFWELINTERNPMGLFEIPGSSRRWKRPIILTVDQYFAMTTFFDGWPANMSLKNLAYSHFRKAVVEHDRKSTWYCASKDLA